MNEYEWEKYARVFDERRKIVVPGDAQATVEFSVQQIVTLAREAIEQRGVFSMALSGGSTPKKIYELLCSEKYRMQIDWEHVLLFWSDERAVSPESQESNYRMAMDAGFAKLPIPKKHIFRMEAEKEIEKSALDYEKTLNHMLEGGIFDLVMLGMGDDCHTASLFPGTDGLHVNDRLTVANYIPKLDTWRMSLTFKAINLAREIVIYVLGEKKAPALEKALLSPYDPETLPIQKIGTPSHPALFITDIGYEK